MRIWFDNELGSTLNNKTGIFENIMMLRGQTIREREGRCTQLIALNGQNYFIKQFSSFTWKKLIKYAFAFRVFELSTTNEYQILQRLKSIKVDVPNIYGYGHKHSFNPTKMQSFLITESLLNHTVSLSDFCSTWKESPPLLKLKFEILKKVAQIAKKLHSHGIIHQDFYSHHFFIDTTSLPHNIKIYLIDLHRAFKKNKPRQRWLVKDIAGVYSSARFIGLTQRDMLRFAKEYWGLSLREIFLTKKNFLSQVKNRGEKIYEMEKEKQRIKNFCQ